MASALSIVVDARATTRHFPGVGRATRGLLQGLQAIELPHHIAVLEWQAAPLERRPHGSLTVISVPAGPLSLRQQWELPLLARALKPDLWHVPYIVRPFVCLPRPVVTVHDVIGRVVPGALPTLRARVLFELTLRLSLRGAVQIIAPSAATWRDLQRHYNVAAERITVIPQAADAHFVPQAAATVAGMRERLGLPERYVLYLGSNKPHKNLPLLVAAFARLDTDATLVIAGHWDRRFDAALRVIHRYGLDRRVRVLGDIPDADAAPLIAGALAFVFPSQYEGFGLPPLEAMATGVPVIAADTSSLPEVVGDGGLLVAPVLRHLADAMQTVLDDSSLRERLRERGLLQAQRFSWERTAGLTLAVYQRAVATST